MIDQNEPLKCEHCHGKGWVRRFRRDDRWYPVKCATCKGRGTQ